MCSYVCVHPEKSVITGDTARDLFQTSTDSHITWYGLLPSNVQQDLSWLWRDHGCINQSNPFFDWVISMLLRVLRGFSADLIAYSQTGQHKSDTWIRDLPPLVKQVFGSFLRHCVAERTIALLDLRSRRLKLAQSGVDIDVTLTPLAMMKYLVAPSKIEKKLEEYEASRGPGDRFHHYGGVESGCDCGNNCVGPAIRPSQLPVSDQHRHLGQEVVITVAHEEVVMTQEDRHRMVLPFAPAITVFDQPQILDVGSGDGRFEDAVREVFPKASVLSYDPDPGSASSLSGVKLQDIRAQFDIVTMNQVLHHTRVKHPKKFFLKLSYLLRPGGILVVREDVVSGRVGEDEHRAHNHRSSKVESIAYLTELEIYNYARKAGLHFLHEMPPNDFPVLRANRYARVYYMIKDFSVQLPDYVATSRRVLGRYRQLKQVVIDQQNAPRLVYEALQAAGATRNIAFALVDHMRGQGPPQARLEYQEPYRLLRLAAPRLKTIVNYRNALLYSAVDLYMGRLPITKAALFFRLCERYGSIDGIMGRTALKDLIQGGLLRYDGVVAKMYVFAVDPGPLKFFQDYDHTPLDLTVCGDVESNPGPCGCNISPLIWSSFPVVAQCVAAYYSCLIFALGEEEADLVIATFE